VVTCLCKSVLPAVKAKTTGWEIQGKIPSLKNDQGGSWDCRRIPELSQLFKLPRNFTCWPADLNRPLGLSGVPPGASREFRTFQGRAGTGRQSAYFPIHPIFGFPGLGSSGHFTWFACQARLLSFDISIKFFMLPFALSFKLF
jgi:hypothetical protein